MPATIVSQTTRLVVYEIDLGTSILRLSVEGRFLVVDPATGQITGGTVSKITNLEYAESVTEGAGRTWSNINLPAGDVSVLLGNANWHVPQPATLEFYAAMSALPATTIVSTFTAFANFVQGGTGADALIGTNKGDVMMGGAGNDRLYGSTGGDELHGEDGNDSLYGQDDEDVLHGGAGDDRLVGGAGYNTLFGGDGNDAMSTGDDGASMQGGNGSDTMNGGAGDDDLRGGSDADVINGAAGFDTVFGDEGDDRLSGGAGEDAIYGGDGNDRIRAGTEADILHGEDGNDRLDAEDGDDLLFGGVGDDTLNGGAGNDVIHMETGNDAANGGIGNDQFIFNEESSGAKVISGFSAAEDQVVFQQFDGNTAAAYQYFLDHSAAVGRNVIFTDGGLSITFARTLMSDFSVNTFGIVGDDEGGGGGGIQPT
jgi:Ca2+-binding RTX toxin-like protein